MASCQKINIKDVIWRGAWILVIFNDRLSRYFFDEVQITLSVDDELIACGRADSFYNTLVEHDDRVMIDIAEFFDRQKIPNVLKFTYHSVKYSIPIIITGQFDEVKKNSFPGSIGVLM